MSKNVFILGAGCSFDAGVPLMRNFLDVSESIARTPFADGDPAFKNVFKGYDALQGVYSKTADIDLLNLESVFIAFEMARLLKRLRTLDEETIDKLVPSLRRVIVKTIELSMRFPFTENGVDAPVPYGEFAKIVKTLKNRAIITFNYDVGIDYALTRNGVPINYSLGPCTEQGSVDLLKLHGSLNWYCCSTCPHISILKLNAPLTSYASDDFATLRLSSVGRGSCEACHKGSPFSEEPTIVPPTWNKAGDSQPLAEVWRGAARHLSDAENIFVIGYSLPPTDMFFHYLYALGTMSEVRIKRFWVFNPDPDLEQRYRSLLGPTAESRFFFKEIDFKGAIEYIKERFANF